MIKLVLVSALVAFAAAATFPPFRQPIRQPLPTPLPVSPIGRIPQPTYSSYPQPGPYIAIIRSSSDIAPDGSSYDYSYETQNGISAQQSGRLAGSGQEVGIAAQGSFQWTSPEGLPVQISYVADENGYQPQGNVLPTPPPIPEAILRSIAYNQAHPEPQTVVTGIRSQYYKK